MVTAGWGGSNGAPRRLVQVDRREKRNKKRRRKVGVDTNTNACYANQSTHDSIVTSGDMNNKWWPSSISLGLTFMGPQRRQVQVTGRRKRAPGESDFNFKSSPKRICLKPPILLILSTLSVLISINLSSGVFAHLLQHQHNHQYNQQEQQQRQHQHHENIASHSASKELNVFTVNLVASRHQVDADATGSRSNLTNLVEPFDQVVALEVDSKATGSGVTIHGSGNNRTVQISAATIKPSTTASETTVGQQQRHRRHHRHRWQLQRNNNNTNDNLGQLNGATTVEHSIGRSPLGDRWAPARGKGDEGGDASEGDDRDEELPLQPIGGRKKADLEVANSRPSSKSGSGSGEGDIVSAGGRGCGGTFGGSGLANEACNPSASSVTQTTTGGAATTCKPPGCGSGSIGSSTKTIDELERSFLSSERGVEIAATGKLSEEHQSPQKHPEEPLNLNQEAENKDNDDYNDYGTYIIYGLGSGSQLNDGAGARGGVESDTNEAEVDVEEEDDVESGGVDNDDYDEPSLAGQQYGSLKGSASDKENKRGSKERRRGMKTWSTTTKRSGSDESKSGKDEDGSAATEVGRQDKDDDDIDDNFDYDVHDGSESSNLLSASNAKTPPTIKTSEEPSYRMVFFAAKSPCSSSSSSLAKTKTTPTAPTATSGDYMHSVSSNSESDLNASASSTSNQVDEDAGGNDDELKPAATSVSPSPLASAASQVERQQVVGSSSYINNKPIDDPEGDQVGALVAKPEAGPLSLFTASQTLRQATRNNQMATKPSNAEQVSDDDSSSATIGSRRRARRHQNHSQSHKQNNLHAPTNERGSRNLIAGGAGDDATGASSSEQQQQLDEEDVRLLSGLNKSRPAGRGGDNKVASETGAKSNHEANDDDDDDYGQAIGQLTNQRTATTQTNQPVGNNLIWFSSPNSNFSSSSSGSGDSGVGESGEQEEQEAAKRQSSSNSYNLSVTMSNSNLKQQQDDFISSSNQDLHQHQVHYWRLVWLILPLGATFGNLLVIMAVYLERSLQSVTNYFIVSLAFADLFVGLIVMPLAVYVLVNEVWELSDTICDMFVAVDVTSSTASILNLVAISIDRYLAVAHPIAYSAGSSSTRAIITIFMVWLISCCVGAPIILGLNTSPDRKSSLCILYNSTFIFWSSLTSFYVPCIIMIGLYWRIFSAIRSRAKKAMGGAGGGHHHHAAAANAKRRQPQASPGGPRNQVQTQQKQQQHGKQLLAAPPIPSLPQPQTHHQLQISWPLEGQAGPLNDKELASSGLVKQPPLPHRASDSIDPKQRTGSGTPSGGGAANQSSGGSEMPTANKTSVSCSQSQQQQQQIHLSPSQNQEHRIVEEVEGELKREQQVQGKRDSDNSENINKALTSAVVSAVAALAIAAPTSASQVNSDAILANESSDYIIKNNQLTSELVKNKDCNTKRRQQEQSRSSWRKRGSNKKNEHQPIAATTCRLSISHDRCHSSASGSSSSSISPSPSSSPQASGSNSEDDELGNSRSDSMSSCSASHHLNFRDSSSSVQCCQMSTTSQLAADCSQCAKLMIDASSNDNNNNNTINSPMASPQANHPHDHKHKNHELASNQTIGHNHKQTSGCHERNGKMELSSCGPSECSQRNYQQQNYHHIATCEHQKTPPAHHRLSNTLENSSLCACGEFSTTTSSWSPVRQSALQSSTGAPNGTESQRCECSSYLHSKPHDRCSNSINKYLNVISVTGSGFDENEPETTSSTVFNNNNKKSFQANELVKIAVEEANRRNVMNSNNLTNNPNPLTGSGCSSSAAAVVIQNATEKIRRRSMKLRQLIRGSSSISGGVGMKQTTTSGYGGQNTKMTRESMKSCANQQQVRISTIAGNSTGSPLATAPGGGHNYLLTQQKPPSTAHSEEDIYSFSGGLNGRPSNAGLTQLVTTTTCASSELPGGSNSGTTVTTSNSSCDPPIRRREGGCSRLKGENQITVDMSSLVAKTNKCGNSHRSHHEKDGSNNLPRPAFANSPVGSDGLLTPQSKGKKQHVLASVISVLHQPSDGQLMHNGHSQESGKLVGGGLNAGANSPASLGGAGHNGNTGGSRQGENSGALSRGHRQGGSRRRREKNAARRERKATKTLAIVLGIFLICWTPFFTANITDGVCIQLELDCRPGMSVYLVTSWLGYMNSCVNPIIYTIFNMEFRRAFKRILTTWPRSSSCC